MKFIIVIEMILEAMKVVCGFSLFRDMKSHLKFQQNTVVFRIPRMIRIQVNKWREQALVAKFT